MVPGGRKGGEGRKKGKAARRVDHPPFNRFLPFFLGRNKAQKGKKEWGEG